jgi:hypothetical protein
LIKLGKTDAQNLYLRTDEINYEISKIEETLMKLCDEHYENNGVYYFETSEPITQQCDTLLWEKNHLNSELKTIELALEDPEKIGISDPYLAGQLIGASVTMFYLLLIPFSISAAIETIRSIKNRELDLPASRFSEIIMAMGFILAVITFMFGVYGGTSF